MWVGCERCGLPSGRHWSCPPSTPGWWPGELMLSTSDEASLKKAMAHQVCQAGCPVHMAPAGCLAMHKSRPQGRHAGGLPPATCRAAPNSHALQPSPTQAVLQKMCRALLLWQRLASAIAEPGTLGHLQATHFKCSHANSTAF